MSNQYDSPSVLTPVVTRPRPPGKANKMKLLSFISSEDIGVAAMMAVVVRARAHGLLEVQLQAVVLPLRLLQLALVLRARPLQLCDLLRHRPARLHLPLVLDGHGALQDHVLARQVLHVRLGLGVQPVQPAHPTPRCRRRRRRLAAARRHGAAHLRLERLQHARGAVVRVGDVPRGAHLLHQRAHPLLRQHSRRGGNPRSCRRRLRRRRRGSDSLRLSVCVGLCLCLCLCLHRRRRRNRRRLHRRGSLSDSLGSDTRAGAPRRRRLRGRLAVVSARRALLKGELEARQLPDSVVYVPALF
mmetsp:Transcript_7874/g.20020  ORF Transcript_7874/g.20020 Transcript_7874/m.20020 type:complete len:300 (+) Transcript_7874:88-987(+)